MKMSHAGLTAEFERAEEPRIRTRMLLILEKRRRKLPASNVVIVDKIDEVYYEIIDGFETKTKIPV